MSGKLAIVGAQVLSMDSTVGDFERADILIDAGQIVAVGPSMDLSEYETIDADGLLAMPGFVDTHWHLWECPLRGMLRGDDPQQGYFPTTNRCGPVYTPEDSARGARFGLAEAVLSGVTTVHNWAHNLRSPEHADAELAAMKESGIRGRFSYGPGKDTPASQPIDAKDVERVVREQRRDMMIDVGVVLRNLSINNGAGIPEEVFSEDLGLARHLNLPSSMHIGARGIVDALARQGALYSDLTLVHPQGMSEKELDELACNKVRICTASVIELSFSAVRNGLIQFSELESRAIRMGLCIDSSSVMGVDFFAIMRALLWSNWQRPGLARIAPRRLVELATLGGAEVLGIDDRVGSLTPGKRADIILIRLDDTNLAPVEDPYFSLVFEGQPANIDTVLIEGRPLLRNRKHTEVDLNKIVQDVKQTVREIKLRLN